MNKEAVRPIPNFGYFTAFVHDEQIDMLVRTSDWYTLSPIQRYLYNMAAEEIRMEDARTETRVYTFEKFDRLRRLIQWSEASHWEAAWEAWVLWGSSELEFGVVHLDQTEGQRGNLLVGDDPIDVQEFAPDDESRDMIQVQAFLDHGREPRGT